MAIHFSVDELAQRRQRVVEELTRRELDGLLIFSQESMYYLTGYDTFGYCFFQCLYLGADGRFALVTRSPDLRQAQRTSVIDDIRIWVDGEDQNPAQDLNQMLHDYVSSGSRPGNVRLGVELESHGLTARDWQRVDTTLSPVFTLCDASDLVTQLRVIKSPHELEYVRRAAQLADEAYDAALETAAPGAFEGDILAAMHNAIFKGGGDYAGNEFIIGAGDDALLCRYFSGRKHLEDEDQMTLEWAGAYRHYHAAMMRTIPIGKIHPQHASMHEACLDAMHACYEVVVPGNAVGQIFDAHARVMDAAGFHDARLNACGYGLGTTYTPSWMDWPMLCTGVPLEIRPGMVFFLNMVLMDSAANRAMTLGHTVIVTDSGIEQLSRHPLGLVMG